jgi:hypothetical protein
MTSVNAQAQGHRFSWFLPDGRHFLYTDYGMSPAMGCAPSAGLESDGFQAQPLARLDIRRQMCGQYLDGYLPAKFGVLGSVHLTHPARAEWREDLVGT